MTIRNVKLALTLAVGAALTASLPFVTLAQTHKGVAPPASRLMAQASRDHSGDAPLEQAARATGSLRSLSADIEGKSLIPPAQWAPLATLMLKRPAQARSETPGAGGQTSVVNGDSFWFYLHRDKTYQQEAGVNLKEDRVGPAVFSTFFFNPGLPGLI